MPGKGTGRQIIPEPTVSTPTPLQGSWGIELGKLLRAAAQHVSASSGCAIPCCGTLGKSLNFSVSVSSSIKLKMPSLQYYSNYYFYNGIIFKASYLSFSCYHNFIFIIISVMICLFSYLGQNNLIV